MRGFDQGENGGTPYCVGERALGKRGVEIGETTGGGVCKIRGKKKAYRATTGFGSLLAEKGGVHRHRRDATES